MNYILCIVALCSVLSVSCFPQVRKRPAYIECAHPDDCSFDSCCVLGMGRYSIPQCQKKIQLYEACRPASDEPLNTTVTYLDGNMVSLQNVHLVMCPCADGLVCDPRSGRCEDFDSHGSPNEIQEGKYIED